MHSYESLLKEAQELIKERRDGRKISEKEFRKRATELLYHAERYGVAPEIKRILESWKQPEEKETSGYNYHNLPLRNREEVKKAASWFKESRSRFPYSVRRSQATQILQKAQELGVDLDNSELETLCKSAGIGLVNPAILKFEIKKRAEYLEKEGKSGGAESLRRILQEIESTDDETYFYKAGFCYRLTEFLDSVDRRYELFTKYGSKLQLPEDAVYFDGVEPIAQVASLVGNVKTGKYYLREDLERLDLQEFKEVLGDKFVKQATVGGQFLDPDGLRTWLRSATLDEARIFDVLAATQGVRHKAERIPEV